MAIGHTQYQVKTEPVTVPAASTTIYNWHQPWTDPVKVKVAPALAIALIASGLFAPVLNPNTQITQNFESRWHQPWSEPVRVRIDPKLAIALGSSGLIAPVLNPDTQITQTYESRWHQPWSTPVWVKRPTWTGSQQVLAFGATPIIPALWYEPLSDPVRVKSGLATTQQAAFTLGQVPIIPTILYEDLSTPAKLAKSGLRPDLQQTLAWNTTTPATEIVTVDKWFVELATPPKGKPSTLTARQQDLALGATPIIPTWWYEPLVDPVRLKIGLATTQQSAFTIGQVPIIPVISYEDWPIPTKLSKSGLRPDLQQFTAWNTTTPAGEVITVDKWFVELATPPKGKPGTLFANQQSFTLGSVPIIPVISYEDWSTPVKLAKAGLRPDLQQFAAWNATTPAAEIITVDKWYEAWGEPLRYKLRGASLQDGFFAPTTIVTVTLPTVATSILSTEVTFKTRIIYQALAQPVVFTSAEVITVDKWLQAWTAPLRSKVGLPAQLQVALAYPPFQFTEIITADKWLYPWAEPVRVKKGLFVGLQQSTTPETPIYPILTRLIQWFSPLQEPLRPKRGLLAALQSFFSTDTKPPPTAAVTVVMNAREVNGDVAAFGVSIFNRAVRANVSIRNIPAIDSANASIEET